MESPSVAVAETLRQVVYGRDFEPPAKLLASLSPLKATTVPRGCPYSVATNIAHAEQWQRSWLHTVAGLPKFEVYGNVKDFPVVEPAEWPQVRQAFLDGMSRALDIAEADPFVHAMRSDDAALRVLNQIAVHGAYHLGQVKLLKRILWATRNG